MQKINTQSVRVVSDGTSTTVTGAHGSMKITASVDLPVQGMVDITVDRQLFMTALEGIGSVGKVYQSGSRLVLERNDGKSRYSISGQTPAVDNSPLTWEGEGFEVDIDHEPAKYVNEDITKVSYPFTGISMRGEKLRIAGTDTRTICAVQTDSPWGFDINVPKQMFLLLPDRCRVYVTDDFFMASFDNYIVRGRLIGQYPDYERIFPAEVRDVSVDIQELLTGLKTMKSEIGATIHLSNGTMSITSLIGEYNIPCQHAEEGRWNVTIKRLIQALSQDGAQLKTSDRAILVYSGNTKTIVT